MTSLLIPGAEGPYKLGRLYRISLLFWAIIGLSWLSLVIGSIQDLFQTVVDKTQSLEDPDDSGDSKVGT